VIFTLRVLHLVLLIPFVVVPGGLAPSERVQWNQWYWIPIDAAINTGFVIIAWKLLRALGMGLWRGVRALALRVGPKRALPSAPERVAP
jgi:hypothetical protein